MSVLVFLENRGNDWNRLSFETITAGRQIAQALQVPVEAAVLGANAQELASEAAKYELAKIYSVEHPLLASYTSDAFTQAAEQVIRKAEPSVILFPHSYRTRDFAPKLAARFGTFLLSDVVSVIAG